MSRTKEVFPRGEVARLWAQGLHAKGCSAGNNGSIYFEGPILYSYGSHYVAGKIVETNNGRGAFINSTNYSRTTSKHTQAAYYATLAGFKFTLKVADPRSAEFDQATFEAQLAVLQAQADDIAEMRPSQKKKYAMGSLGSLVRQLAKFEGQLTGDHTTTAWAFPQITIDPAKHNYPERPATTLTGRALYELNNRIRSHANA